MATIKPFKGLTYNRKKVLNIQSVMAPPYDVISSKMQSHFYELNPYNIIRLILGKETKKDNGKNNKYTRARKFLDSWLKNDVVLVDKKPCIYIYQQIYLFKNKKKTRTGFISLMKIEDPKKSGILPHEYTLSKPKKDRFKLIKSVGANLSPIFSLYDDKKSVISKILKKEKSQTSALIDINFEGVNHKLWKIADPKIINSIKAQIKKKKIFIADGHHRYEVSLMYKKYLAKKKKSGTSSDYVMMYFTNLRESSNVAIFATHRLLKKISNKNINDILSLLKGSFNATLYNSSEALIKQLSKKINRPSYGVYMGKNKFYLISLKKHLSTQKIISGNKSSQWKRLDVAVLHNYVLKDLLSLKDAENNIKYVREPEHAVRLINDGEYAIAFFLNPTRAKQVRDVAEKKDMMPQKSTYFYPKLLTGLTINKF